MTAQRCPKCQKVYDYRRHSFVPLEAMEGRVPGLRWCHRRPDNGKDCYYDDAGPLPPAYTSDMARGILTITKDADVPDEARMAG